MSWSEFKDAPWQTPHPAYEKSELAMKPAPEYASSEILLSSLYRTIGMADVRESEVSGHGRDLLRRLDAGKQPVGATVTNEVWSRVLQGSLEIPRLTNQSAKRFLQLTPLVPEATRYSGSARLSGNPWSPGQLIQRMILLGAPSLTDAKAIWQELHIALSVGSDDDVWARWLQSEFRIWQAGESSGWSMNELRDAHDHDFVSKDAKALHFPAQQFVKDLRAVISAKDAMTRRQWTSLLEAVLRIAASAHVMWICDVGQRTWMVVRSALDGAKVPDFESVHAGMYPVSLTYFPYGSAAMDKAKELTSRYLYSRLGLNAALWALEAIGSPFAGNISTAEGVTSLAAAVFKHRKKFESLNFNEVLLDFGETDAKTLSCNKGIGKNALEFVRHTMGQRQPANEVLRGYDQGYGIRKRGLEARSRWIVGLGPVAVIALAHCCLHQAGGARSVQRLCEHFSRYGIRIGKDEVASSDLGQKLRMLGLVLDSPDAESGMLVLPPFGFNTTLSDGKYA